MVVVLAPAGIFLFGTKLGYSFCLLHLDLHGYFDAPCSHPQWYLRCKYHSELAWQGIHVGWQRTNNSRFYSWPRPINLSNGSVFLSSKTERLDESVSQTMIF